MNKFFKSAAAVLGASAIIFSTGCAAVFIGSSTEYPNADKYTSGDIEISDKISSLDINWTSGDMELSYYDGNTISVKETCKVSLSDEKKVHTWVDGETLRIQFAKSGENLTSSESDKKLDVKLPKDIQLSSVVFNGSSCDYIMDGIEAETFTVNSSSGNGNLTKCSAKKITANSSSGGIGITQTGTSDSIKADSSSGRIMITAEEAGSITADASSGNVTINADKAGKVSTDTSSGDVTVTVLATPSEMKFDASSGDITLYLPEDAEFTADIDTSSGSFNSEISLSKNGSSYVAGSGSGKLSVDTSSGDISIKKASK